MNPAGRRGDLIRAVLASLLPLCLVTIGIKIHKIVRLSRGAGLAVPSLLAYDVLFLILYGAAWGLLLRVSPPRLRRALLLLLQVLSPALLCLLVIEHAYFLITGTLLDFYLIRYTIQHFSEVRPIIASELSAPMIVFLVAIAATGAAPRGRHLLPATLVRLGLPMATGLLLASLCLILARLPVPAALSPLRPDPLWAWGAQAIESARSVRTELGKSALRPAQPLRVSATAGAQRYNVVLVVLESARAHSTTPYDPGLPTMPFLASLARRGALVQKAYTVIPHTSKALVAIECGIFPKIDIGVDEATVDALPTDCLATLLRQQGYATAFFYPGIEGFEQRDQVVKNIGFQTYRGLHSMPRDGFDVTSNYFGCEDDILIQPSLDWVDAQQAPFFLTYLTVTAHHNYHVPKGFPKNDYVADASMNRYLNTLRYTDRFLSKVMAEFQARGLLDRTLFVFIGDHGEGFGEHGRKFHDNTIYEEGLQVPLVLFGAGVSPGGRIIEGLRQNIDIVPTVLEVLGLRIDQGREVLPGRSLLSTAGHQRLYFSCWYQDQCMALRDGDRKLVYHYGNRPAELFDLAVDPSEQVDLAPREPALVAGLTAELLRWKERSNATYEAQALFRRPRFVTRTKTAPQHPTDILLSPAIRLRGFDVDRTVYEMLEAAELTYHFEVLGPPPPGWDLFVHLVGPTGVVLDAEHVPVEGSYPLERWRPGEFIQDHQRIFLTGFPAGTYDVVLGLWNRSLPPGANRMTPIGKGALIDAEHQVHVATLRVLPDTRRPK